MLSIKKRAFWTLLCILSGISAGMGAAVFLILLDWATNARLANPTIIWGLPLAGLFIGLAYHHLGKDVEAGHNLILDEIHDPKKTVPWKMAPMILVGTVLTHLFGGSAGREGTAVQIGASLSDQISSRFKVSAEERKILLVAGAGAGFGAAIGAPWAGVIFGMEVIYVSIKKLRLFALWECFVASFTGYAVTLLLRAPHSHYPEITIPRLSFGTCLSVVIAGALFGLASRLFIFATHAVEKAQDAAVRAKFLRPVVGGLVLVALYACEGSYRYAGLGISSIQEAISTPLGPIALKFSIYKLLFTAITIGSGFKGGEFIPLVFIGATLGCALATVLPVSFSLLAATGFAAVFAGAANTPVACSIMAIEIFGWPIAPYAIIACFMSYFCSSRQGIYKKQRMG